VFAQGSVCGMACMRERAGWSSGCFIRDDDSSRVVKTLQADDKKSGQPDSQDSLARVAVATTRYFCDGHMSLSFSKASQAVAVRTLSGSRATYGNRTGKRLLLSLWHFLRAFLPTAEARDRETAARMAAPRCSEGPVLQQQVQRLRGSNRVRGSCSC
jgi:hypothetical protein